MALYRRSLNRGTFSKVLSLVLLFSNNSLSAPILTAGMFTEENNRLGAKSLSVPTIQEFESIRKKAMDGDVESELFMGIFHANGSFVCQSYAKAAEWYRKAAEQGEKRAQRYLGLLLSLGVGIERDRKEAFHWFWKADKAGDVAASLELGAYPLFYRESIMDFRKGNFEAWRAKAFYLINLDGNEPSLEENFWLKYNAQCRYSQNDSLLAAEVRRMAEEGCKEAQVDMVKLHILGQGVPVDPQEIDKWLTIAVENGEPYAEFLYGFSWDNPYFSVPDYLTRLKLIEKAANSESEKYFILINCMLKYYWELYGYENVGTLLRWKYKGLNRVTDEAKYRQELTTLADSGYLPAEWILAHHYSLFGYADENSANNYRIPPNAPQRAAELYEKITRNNFIYAYVKLVRIYCVGDGVKADYAKALKFIDLFREYPDSRIWESLAHSLEKEFSKGSANAERLRSMVLWFTKKAKEGSISAQLICSIFNRPRILDDREMETKWLIIAATSNSCAAYDILIRRKLLKDEELPQQIISDNTNTRLTEKASAPLLLELDLKTLIINLIMHNMDYCVKSERLAMGKTMESFCQWVLMKFNCTQSNIYRPSKSMFDNDVWYLNPDIEEAARNAYMRKIISYNLEDERANAKLKSVNWNRCSNLGKYPLNFFR